MWTLRAKQTQGHPVVSKAGAFSESVGDARDRADIWHWLRQRRDGILRAFFESRLGDTGGFQDAERHEQIG